ncbi:MAG: helix-turn-helix domain-containing protein [Proteobacteria bacterium]|nr:helix-turn-helix domain-containing protein [Pseudomonadota bacterium]
MTKNSVRNDEALVADEIGKLLRNARVEAGFSIVQIAEMTRITKSHITALEANDFESLPGAAYIPGFIRNYCKMVGLDSKPLIDAYKQSINPVLAKPEYKFPVQALVPKMAGSMVAMFVVVAGLAGYIGWNFLQEDVTPTQQIASLEEEAAGDLNRFDQTEAVGPEILTTEPADSRNLQTENVAPAPVITPEQPAAVETPAAVVAEQAVAENKKLAPVPSEASQTGAMPVETAQAIQKPVAQNTDAGASAPDTTSRPDTAVVAQAPVQPDAAPLSGQVNKPSISGTAAQALSRAPMSEIIISASAASWIEIAKSNGEIVVSKLLRKGDQFIATADTDLFLSTGNAGGIRLAVGDQQAVQIGKVGEIIRDLALNRDSLSQFNSTSDY